MNVEKESISIFSDLSVQTLTYHTLSYLYLLQTKKEESLRHDTVISHYIQYLVDDTSIPDLYVRKVLDIDHKRKIISLGLLSLESIYVSLQTLEKLIQFETALISGYIKMIKYFDNYGFRFSIVSVENETGAFRKKKQHHKIAVDVYESKVNMKSKDEIADFITSVSKDLDIEVTVNLNTYQNS